MDYKQTDKEIIDECEFIELVQKYQNNMYRLAKSIVRRECDAEDAVSNAVYQAFKSINTLQNKDSFKSWILKIVSNESLMLFRKNKKVILLKEPLSENIPAKDEMGTDYDVWNTVQLLQDKYRIIVILFYYEDFSVKQIGEFLNLNENTVKVRLHRARNLIKKELTKKGEIL